eukprot:g80235.t1
MCVCVLFAGQERGGRTHWRGGVELALAAKLGALLSAVSALALPGAAAEGPCLTSLQSRLSRPRQKTRDVWGGYNHACSSAQAKACRPSHAADLTVSSLAPCSWLRFADEMRSPDFEIVELSDNNLEAVCRKDMDPYVSEGWAIRSSPTFQSAPTRCQILLIQVPPGTRSLHIMKSPGKFSRVIWRRSNINKPQQLYSGLRLCPRGTYITDIFTSTPPPLLLHPFLNSQPATHNARKQQGNYFRDSARKTTAEEEEEWKTLPWHWDGENRVRVVTEGDGAIPEISECKRFLKALIQGGEGLQVRGSLVTQADGEVDELYCDLFTALEECIVTYATKHKNQFARGIVASFPFIPEWMRETSFALSGSTASADVNLTELLHAPPTSSISSQPSHSYSQSSEQERSDCVIMMMENEEAKGEVLNQSEMMWVIEERANLNLHIKSLSSE